MHVPPSASLPLGASQTDRPVPTAGEALRDAVIVFFLPNPDGWRAGQRLGTWMDSPLGLGGVGINNEMFVSAVFERALVQTHIDGNKGLIHSQIASLLAEEPVAFRPTGLIGYVLDPERLQVPADAREPNPGLPAQDDVTVDLPCSGDACAGGAQASEGLAPTWEFDVLGPEAGVWNGGITVVATQPSVPARPTPAAPTSRSRPSWRTPGSPSSPTSPARRS